MCSKETLNRSQLIEICEKSILPYQKWENRDSGASQVMIADIYRMLKSGAEYEYTIENQYTIWIEFKNLTYEIIRKAISNDIYNLNYDTVEEYLEKFPEEEMFEGYGLDLGRLTEKDFKKEKIILRGYLPTFERLKQANGEDWY